MSAILNRLTLLMLVMLTVAGVVTAEPMTYSGRFDIGPWLEAGRQQFDFEKEDAVVLLEGQKTTLMEDGRRSTLVHRLVWITTDHAIETYADLRVPWDSERQTLDVKALRVFRDNRWIDHRPTAIVETLPFEVGEAPEYSWLRETMLLHDGVELPCLLEACYVIEDKEPVANGIEGVWIFPQEDPVVHSWLIFDLPMDVDFHLELSDELGEAEITEADGRRVYSMDRGPYDAAPDPETADPAAYLPHASWSTWGDWESYGNDLRSIFDTAAAQEGSVLNDSLAVLLEGSTGPAESANRIAGFINSHVRFIDYEDDFFWLAPRSPETSYLSGYATGLDRAVLFSSLCKMAGIENWAVYRGPGFGLVDEGIPTNDRLGTIGVWASGDGLEGWYDPASGKVVNGLAPILGRSLWLPGAQDVPQIRWSGAGDTNTLSINLDLAYDAENGCWKGDGFVHAAGGLCPFDKMEGVHNDALAFLGKVVGGMAPGAKVTAWNPLAFDRFSVQAGIDVGVKAKKDDRDRVVFAINDPAHGVIETLPADIDISHAERATPAFLPGYLKQVLTVTLDLDDLEAVYLPEASSIENSAGSFGIEVEKKDGKVIVTRTISLRTLEQSADGWNDLRALLLAETSSWNRTLLFR
ncbi:DUF3857 domain-containing protein [bacterium]|nr:DUF3857 domain-containing protein [bacterium]